MSKRKDERAASVTATLSVSTNTDGYKQLLCWAQTFGLAWSRMPHGYGQRHANRALGLLQDSVSVSVNDITDENCIDALTGVPVLNSLSVSVAKAVKGRGPGTAT